jgi:hypothetical protein
VSRSNRQAVQVHYGEGVAIRIGSAPCVDTREGARSALGWSDNAALITILSAAQQPGKASLSSLQLPQMTRNRFHLGSRGSGCGADAESATLFQPLFDDAVIKHNVTPGQLTLHADRGSPMKAKATVFLAADLGVTRWHNLKPAHCSISVHSFWSKRPP